MKEVLQKTLSVSRELEALKREHQLFLSHIQESEECTSGKLYGSTLHHSQVWPAPFFLGSTEPL